MCALIVIGFLGSKVLSHSAPEDKLKNLAVVLTGGSVMIGIFYSIINYEHNMHKFNHDVQTQKELLTFSTASLAYKTETVLQLGQLHAFYNKHELKFENNLMSDVYDEVKKDGDTNIAMIVIFNYFESISIGMEQGIMDESFMKGFFKTSFIGIYNKFGCYIEFLQIKNNSSRIFWKYVAISKKWKFEN